MSGHNDQIIDKQGTALGFLARFWWMFFGNMFFAFSLIFILFNKGGFFHPADWVLWITVATLVSMRYIDIRFCDGQTAAGGLPWRIGPSTLHYCWRARWSCGGSLTS